MEKGDVTNMSVSKHPSSGLVQQDLLHYSVKERQALLLPVGLGSINTLDKCCLFTNGSVVLSYYIINCYMWLSVCYLMGYYMRCIMKYKYLLRKLFQCNKFLNKLCSF